MSDTVNEVSPRRCVFGATTEDDDWLSSVVNTTHVEKMMRDIRAANYHVVDLESGISAMTRMLDDLRRYGYGWLSQELGDVFDKIPFATDESEDEISKLEHTNDSLEKDVTQLEDEVESLENKIIDLENDVSTLEVENELLQKEIKRLVEAENMAKALAKRTA